MRGILPILGDGIDDAGFVKNEGESTADAGIVERGLGAIKTQKPSAEELFVVEIIFLSQPRAEVWRDQAFIEQEIGPTGEEEV